MGKADTGFHLGRQMRSGVTGGQSRGRDGWRWAMGDGNQRPVGWWSIRGPATELEQHIESKDSSGQAGKAQEGKEENDKYGAFQTREDRDKEG